MRVRVGLAAALATAAMWAMFVLGAGPAAAAPLSPFNVPPVPSFTYSTPDTAGVAITFDASSSSDPNGGTITDYQWDFGDGTGTVDNGAAPTTPHTYTSPGTYTVTLKVTDSEGDTSGATQQTVVVSAPPTASFTVGSPDVATTPISFDASASNDPNAGGSITNYHWDFGDGTAAVDTTSPTASHTYAGPGTPTVTLTVTDAEGGTATTSQPVTVTAAAPTAAFTVGTPDTATTPISFDASASNDPNSGGSITNYHWDFGDGTPAVDTTSPTASHTYAAPGTYTVTLTVTDAEGGTATTSHTVTVTAAAPTASFTGPTGGVDSTPVSFSASASNDPNSGGSITNYHWDFGDGTPAVDTTSPTASHTYAAPGTYTATLTVTDAEGGTATTSRSVVIDDAPATASMSFSPTSPNVGTAVSFTGSRTGGDPSDSAPAYSWVFGDGANSTAASPAHVYQTPGTYTVTLTLTDDDGRTTTSRRITVTPYTGPYSAPTAAFTAPVGLAGFPVTFDGSQSHDPNAGGSLSYRWDFGDGGVGAGVRPSHTFAAGTWQVTLAVTDNVSGRSNEVSHKVTIASQRLMAAFAAPVGAAGRAVSFAAQASNGHYRWSFGDGSHGSGRSPRHTYKRRGTYTVTLTVTDSSGHKASISHPVTIGAANACVVPALVGDTLSAAGRALKAGHCTLGHVTAPHAPKHSPGHGRVWTRVVTSQRPSGPRLKASRFAVAVTVAYVARPA